MVQSDQGMEDISLKPGCLTQGLHDPQNTSATLWHVCARSIPIVGGGGPLQDQGP